MKKILVISYTPTHPADSGAAKRIYNFLYHLKNLGFEIHFVFNDVTKMKADIRAMKKKWDRVYVPKDIKADINRKIGKIGIFINNYSPKLYKLLKKIKPKNKKPITKQKLPIDDFLYNKKTDDFLKKLSKKGKYSFVLIEHTAQSIYLKNFPNSLKIIDTHDALTNKESLEANPELKDYTNEDEAKVLNRADIIIAIQEHEEKFFKSIVGKYKKVVTVGHIEKSKQTTSKPTNRKNLMFIGFNHKVNEKWIKFFINKVFSKIKEKHPEVKLIIAGAISKTIKNQPGIIKLGKIKNLHKLYNLTDIVICPLLTGTGLKIKNIEALAYGKPLVTTKIGIKGIEKAKNKAFLLANNEKEFIKQINKLLTNKKLYNNLSQGTHKFIKDYNKKNIKKLKQIFN